MARLPYDARADLRAFNLATSGPSSMVPPSDPASSQPARSAPNTSGWQAQRELGPQRDIELIDRMCVNADQREREQATAPDVMAQIAAACTAMVNLQSQTIQALALLLNNNDAEKDATAAPRKKP
jgi:hypothetical protein